MAATLTPLRTQPRALTQVQKRMSAVIPATEATSVFHAAGESLAKDLIAG
jgi:hypothetical protein